MGHAFKPCSSDCGRCAVCLRSLDCAPHLPLTPRATWPGLDRAIRNGTMAEKQRPESRLLEEWRHAVAAVQGGR